MKRTRKKDKHKKGKIVSGGIDYHTVTGITDYYESLGDNTIPYDPFEVKEQLEQREEHATMAQLIMDTLPIIIGPKLYTQYLAIEKYGIEGKVVGDFYGITADGARRNSANAKTKILDIVKIVEKKSLMLDAMYYDLARLLQLQSDTKEKNKGQY